MIPPVGSTPLQESPALARWSGVRNLWLKREDANPTGSHKDRGALEQVRACRRAGRRVAVISSSGNAALAAATLGREVGLTVVALVSPLTENAKVSRLTEAGARVVVARKPINFATRLARVTGWSDLRPSTSPEALLGFRTLGEELADELNAGVPVFGYASSGTTFAAIGAIFADRGSQHPLHPVQAGVVNGFSKEFGRPGDGSRSVIGDLGVKVSPRTDQVLRLVRESGGEAWWSGPGDIDAGRAALEAEGIHVAAECWAALGGVRLAARAAACGSACLVITGQAVPGDGLSAEAAGLPVAESFDEVRAAVVDLGA